MLFLFDYDGVIADSFELLLDVCVEAQAALGRGRAPSHEDFRTIENLTFDELARTIGIPEDLCEAYCAKTFEIQRQKGTAPPFQAVVEVIQKLAVQHPVAVVTNSQGKAVHSALEGFGLGDAIASVAGGESGLSKADRIAALRAAYALPPEAVYMIGDTVGDIRAGKQAGVQTVAVTWGFQSHDLLARELPDHLVERPEELLSLSAAEV